MKRSTNQKKKEKASKEEPPAPLRGEELYLALQKKWANSFAMRRDHGGKK